MSQPSFNGTRINAANFSVHHMVAMVVREWDEHRLLHCPPAPEEVDEEEWESDGKEEVITTKKKTVVIAKEYSADRVERVKETAREGLDILNAHLDRFEHHYLMTRDELTGGCAVAARRGLPNPTVFTMPDRKSVV